MMGVSHNRWFVERKFLQLANPNLDNRIANRILLDVDADSIDLKDYLARWEISINSNRSQLYPLIANGVDGIQ